MRALSVRQPYAEMILRGVKTIEYRSKPTRIVGERFYLYASQKWAADHGQWSVKPGAAWSRDLAMIGERAAPPAWMLDLAERLILKDLPTGLIVGTAVIDRVTGGDDGLFHWHLAGVERVTTPRKPTGHPQPVWFNPF